MIEFFTQAEVKSQMSRQGDLFRADGKRSGKHGCCAGTLERGGPIGECCDQPGWTDDATRRRPEPLLGVTEKLNR